MKIFNFKTLPLLAALSVPLAGCGHDQTDSQLVTENDSRIVPLKECEVVAPGLSLYSEDETTVSVKAATDYLRDIYLNHDGRFTIDEIDKVKTMIGGVGSIEAHYIFWHGTKMLTTVTRPANLQTTFDNLNTALITLLDEQRTNKTANNEQKLYLHQPFYYENPISFPELESNK